MQFRRTFILEQDCIQKKKLEHENIPNETSCLVNCSSFYKTGLYLGSKRVFEFVYFTFTDQELIDLDWNALKI